MAKSKSATAVSKDILENPMMPVPTNAKIMDIPFDHILADDDFNSRIADAAETDEGHDLEALAESIKKDGQLTPVLVAADNEHPGKYFLVFGFRRFRAMRDVLKRNTIRATIYEPVKKGTEITRAELLYINLVENEERKQLNAFERARRYHQLNKEFGESGSSIAKRIGFDASYVNSLIAAYELPRPIIDRWQREFTKDFQEQKTESRLCTTDNLRKLTKMQKDGKPDKDGQVETFEKWLNPAPVVNPDGQDAAATPVVQPGAERAGLSDLRRARAAVLIAMEETPRLSAQEQARLAAWKEALDWAINPGKHATVKGILTTSKKKMGDDGKVLDAGGKVLDFRGHDFSVTQDGKPVTKSNAKKADKKAA